MIKGRTQIRRLTYSGLLAALIGVLTAFVKIPLPAGFAHVGDGAVVLSGLLLGPYGAIPAAIGSALGDFMAGYQHYAVFSAIIKGIMALVIGRACIVAEGISLRNVLVLLLMFLFMAAGYFPVDTVFYGLEAATASILGNLTQAGIGLALGILILSLGRIFPKKL